MFLSVSVTANCTCVITMLLWQLQYRWSQPSRMMAVSSLFVSLLTDQEGQTTLAVSNIEAQFYLRVLIMKEAHEVQECFNKNKQAHCYSFPMNKLILST